jgi:hypothetical protein
VVIFSREEAEKAGEGGLAAPGRYLAEVVKCEEKNSNKTGEPYFNVEYKRVDTGDHLCFDVIMLGGRGLGIGYKKLLILQAIKKNDSIISIEPHQLIGLRVVLDVVHQQYPGNDGTQKTKCVPFFQGPKDENQAFGYAYESSWSASPPADDEVYSGPPDGEETPF